MRDKLILARNKTGLTVAAMAKELQISASFYYKIEAGTRNPTILLANRIASLLGHTVDDLFFGDELDDSSSKEQAATLDATGTEGR